MRFHELMLEAERLGRYTYRVSCARRLRNRFAMDELAEICFVNTKQLAYILDTIDAHPDWDDEQIAEEVISGGMLYEMLYDGTPKG